MASRIRRTKEGKLIESQRSLQGANNHNSTITQSFVPVNTLTASNFGGSSNNIINVIEPLNLF